MTDAEIREQVQTMLEDAGLCEFWFSVFMHSLIVPFITMGEERARKFINLTIEAAKRSGALDKPSEPS